MKLHFFISPYYFQLFSKFHVSIVLLLNIILWQCSPPQDSNEAQPHSPDSTSQSLMELQHAQGFQVTYFPDYKILSLLYSADTLRYLLLPHDASIPPDVTYDQLIRVPVYRVITQSTTHLAMFGFLDAQEVIIGIDQADYLYDSTFAQRAAEGMIEEVGSGSALNTELVISLQPDLLLISRMPGSSLDPYQKFVNLGIPVLPNAEWMESSPLGKAEWVKLIAALLNQEELATACFSEVKQAYDSLVQLAQTAKKSPPVVVGSPFQGTWYVPGGNSYRSTLLQHSKTHWPWSQDTSAVSFPVDFERMYAHGLHADYWIDPGQARTKDELLSVDGRFADFRAFKQNRIYNSNRRLNANGSGNDYYESGAVYPQRVLADLIRIFHPELLPDHTLYYYQQIH